MDLGLKGKVAVVTGADGGIGNVGGAMRDAEEEPFAADLIHGPGSMLSPKLSETALALSRFW